MALPSGNTTVGTVWLPPLTDITKLAASGSSSMLISAISMPSVASCLLSLRQKAHHVVVYMVSGCATLDSLIRLAVVIQCNQHRRLARTSLRTSNAGPGRRCHAESWRSVAAERRVPYPVDTAESQAFRDPAMPSPAGSGAVEPGAAVSGDGGPDAILAALDPEQRQVALAGRGPVCVLAGAGTGKTRAVAHRIAYLAATGQISPGRVLAVTFTTRAAGELRGRLRQLGTLVPGAGLEQVQARTFHAAALRQLTHFWPSTVGGQAPRVLESKISLIAEAARRVRVQAGLAELRDAASEIEWAKVTQVRPDDYAAASVRAGRSAPFEGAVLR